VTTSRDHLRAHPLLAILRGVPAAHVVPLGEALLAGGVRSLEVTFTDASMTVAAANAFDDAPESRQAVSAKSTEDAAQRLTVAQELCTLEHSRAGRAETPIDRRHLRIRRHVDCGKRKE